MTATQTTAPPEPYSPPNDSFQAGQVLAIASGHLINDSFGSFTATLLPLIIAKLGLSLTLAGSLAAVRQLPSLLNPFLGLLVDRGSLRWLAIAAPTITATAMTLIGLAPTYAALVLLLLVAGISSAFWHVPSPVMIARTSGRRVGQGMSFFMLGGELALTIGPLLAVGAVSWWGLEGIYRLIPLGVASSIILYWRTRNISTGSVQRSNTSLAETWRVLRRVLLPIVGIVVSNGFLSVCLSTYLPTLLSSEGASLWQAGIALSITSLAGGIGAVAGGFGSDRLGHRRVLAFVMLTSPLFMFLFLSVSGWAIYPALIALGIINFSSNPVILALVQTYGRDHPATANGLYMTVGFLGQSFVTLAIGVMADHWGLRTVYHWSAWIGFLGLLFVPMLPKETSDVK